MIHLNVGETHQVALEENPSTGYQWEYEPTNLTHVSINKIHLPIERNVIGQTHEILFEITALQHGHEVITFKYCRAWEKDIEPINSKKITIKIK
ncbi:Predicted secreted protein [Flavobacterium sp. 9AF]|uniref:protease inhibitor I42 family protein n=1 Tax=Flavobacterium sp. 9AF TaxID=2653142 RepID=UPI0012F17147|nr:protease inhibitor I42 family protein [Flavobacterium sp. 9AF]VXB82196.1 Predicted secreted protein [Flavobacterium sp. 9AF]